MIRLRRHRLVQKPSASSSSLSVILTTQLEELGLKKGDGVQVYVEEIDGVKRIIVEGEEG